MSERDVRYCTTSDGIRIAYCVEGEGETSILALPVMYEMFSLDHLMPVYKQFYRDLGVNRRLVRFDMRGSGLSEPGHSFDIGSGAEDTEAVARAAGAEQYVVWASTTGGERAIRFVTNNPDMVSHLILYGSYATAEDAFPDTLLSGLEDLVRANWQTANQTIADLNGRREFPDEAAQLGEWYARSATPEWYLQGREAIRDQVNDVSALLSRVEVPTLVLHRIADPCVPLAAGQKLAAGISDARLVTLEGTGHLFCLGDYGPILRAVDSFLDDGEGGGPADSGADTVPSSGLVTILFTDMESSTSIARLFGDRKAQEVRRIHNSIVRDALMASGGAEIKHTGDGIMASFTSARLALECSIAIQQGVAAHKEEQSDSPLGVYVGLNAGEPIAEEDDLFGTSVDLAARLVEHAQPGQIIASDVVRQLAAGKDFLFADLGETELRGFEDPVKLWELRWQREDG